MSDGQARCAQRAVLRERAALKPLRGMLKGVIGRAAPCTRRGSSSNGNGNGKGQSGIPLDGGALWVCGDAVNPSMEAWSPHPCGSHPANPQCPAFDSFPVASRSTPCVDDFFPVHSIHFDDSELNSKSIHPWLGSKVDTHQEQVMP
ncbi:MAG: hypothetical protein RR831_10020, partial [Stenotrophomonas sp.]